MNIHNITNELEDLRKAYLKEEDKSMKRKLAVAVTMLAVALYIGIMLHGNPQFVQVHHGYEWAVVVWDITNHITIEQGVNLDTLNGMTVWTTVSFPQG